MVFRGMMANRKDDDQEMSMEEILASIRKYVTEEDPNAPKPALREEEEVLDLRHVHSIVDHPSGSQSTGFQNTKLQGPFQTQELPANAVSSVLVHPTEQQSHSHASQVVPMNSHDPSHPTTPQNPLTSEEPRSTTLGGLTSAKSMMASAQALSRLVETTKAAQQVPVETPTGSGVSLESLAIQAMTPYLKNWLDTNLSSLVERLVQREIEHLTQELLGHRK